MKEEKLIGLYLAPHFFAISLFLAFIASRCGFASSLALSYVIAPRCSHILIVIISSVCFIISSLMFAFSYGLDFKGMTFNFQGKMRFFISFLQFFCKKRTQIFIFCIQAIFDFFFGFIQRCHSLYKWKLKRLKNRFYFWLGNGKRWA